jgi:hypothetical protein
MQGPRPTTGEARSPERDCEFSPLEKRKGKKKGERSRPLGKNYSFFSSSMGWGDEIQGPWTIQMLIGCPRRIWIMLPMLVGVHPKGNNSRSLEKGCFFH